MEHTEEILRIDNKIRPLLNFPQEKEECPAMGTKNLSTCKKSFGFHLSYTLR